MFNILVMGLTSLLTDVSTEMVYPLLPLFLTSRLGASPAIVGIIEGIAESVASLLKVFSGAFSDRIGRRKPLAIAGYSFSTIGKFFLVIAQSWLIVLAGRVIDRFGKGVRTAPRDALIAESAQRDRMGAAFGFHRFMDTLGASIGILLSYLLMTKFKGNYQAVFVISLIPAVLGVCCLFFVREKRSAAQGTIPTQGQRLTLEWSSLNPTLKSFLLVAFLFTLGNSSNQFLLMRAQNLGFSATQVILLYFTYNVVYTLFAYPAGKLSDIVGRRSLLVLGYLFYGVVYIGFALVNNPGSLWLLFATYGLYIACTEGVEKALVAEIAPPHQRATLIGLHATLVGIGLLPASALAGMLWNLLGPRAPFLFGGITGICASAAMYRVLASLPRSQLAWPR